MKTPRRKVGDQVAWNGPTAGTVKVGRIVAIVPPHTRPVEFRRTLPMDLARRWACANSPRHDRESYLIEIEGDFALNYPHPRRILDDVPENGENGA